MFLLIHTLAASPAPTWRLMALRGGDSTEQCSAPLADYLQSSSSFVERFEQLVEASCSSCKPSFFGLSPPPPPRIKARPDRIALLKAFQHIRALHAEALTLA